MLHKSVQAEHLTPELQPVVQDGATDVTLLADFGRVGQPEMPLQLLRGVQLAADRARPWKSYVIANVKVNRHSINKPEERDAIA